jgi:hypothetical protein
MQYIAAKQIANNEKALSSNLNSLPKYVVKYPISQYVAPKP